MKLKMIAIAAAMASLAGAAHADLAPPTSNNGSLTLLAVDIVTNNWYIRDTGFFLDDFMPSNITSVPLNNNGLPGNKTPETGLTLDKTNTASFADASFSTWLSAQNAANVRWTLGATDNVGTSTATNVKRFVSSSANPNETVLNSNVDTYISSGSRGGLAAFFGANTLSTSGTLGNAFFLTNFGLGLDSLASLDQGASMYYAARNPATLQSSISAAVTKFGNATGNAVVTLESDGDFSYVLAGGPVSAVPLPAAVWLMGAGLVAVGGAVRRRKVTAAAQA